MNAHRLATAGVFLIVMGCTIRFDWPTHEVEVTVLAERDIMQTVTSDATELRVDAADLSIISSELVGCDTDERLRNLPGLSALGPSIAFAHMVESTTVDATPRTVPTVAAEDVVIARLTPPANQYCAIQIELGPHPGTAAPMTQTTARFAGAMRAPHDDKWTEFEWRTTARATMRIPFDVPLDLGENSQTHRFTVRPNVVRWFELVDAQADTEEAAYIVLETAVSSAEFEQ